MKNPEKLAASKKRPLVARYILGGRVRAHAGPGLRGGVRDVTSLLVPTCWRVVEVLHWSAAKSLVFRMLLLPAAGRTRRWLPQISCDGWRYLSLVT